MYMSDERGKSVLGDKGDKQDWRGEKGEGQEERGWSGGKCSTDNRDCYAKLYK